MSFRLAARGASGLRAGALVTARRFQHIPATTPIGQGQVVKINWSSIKPAYVPKSYMLTWTVMTSWMISNLIPNMIMAFILIWGAHGGFAGYLPPEPRSMHN
eukprot:GILI01014648.1.p1 GENE.GILI01014648.1~~GILI01014648.1.p1  ORF type:complete len:114 (+),score=28.53 GILI01014648.1:37-342(+)